VDSPADKKVLSEWWADLQQGRAGGANRRKVAEYLHHHGFANLEQSLIDSAKVDERTLETWLGESFAPDAPVITVYPQPDLSFLDRQPAWITLLRAAFQQGRTWLHDSGGALCFAVSISFSGPSFAAATKSTHPAQQLFRYELPQQPGQLWEIEVAGFAQDEATFRLEIALLKPDEPNAELAGVPVSVVVGEETITQTSDLGGVVLFADLPKANFDQILIRIAPEE
jgi:hypothetical protein